MSAPEPEVTVIIPTRNRRAFLEQAVSDALRQVDVDLEIVIVDDGSTEAGAVEGIEAVDPRIRIERLETRRGVARARNQGVAAARGAWLAFMDDDDRWAPDKLRTQLDAAARADAAWVYSSGLTIDAHDRVLFTEPASMPAIHDGPLYANPVPGGCSNVVARADLVRAVGGFDEELALIADWDLWIRLAEIGPPATCDDVLVAYRLHPDNMHVRHVHAVDAELTHVARKLNTTALGQPDLLRWHANAYRRAGDRRRAARLYLRRWRLTRDGRDIARAIFSLLGERIVRLVRRRTARASLPRPDWLV